MGTATLAAPNALPPLVAEPPAAYLLTPPLTPTVARPTTDVAVSQLPDAGQPKSNKWDVRIKELSCHVSLVIAGWADASSGPLIPYIQDHYKISYTVVSMLFVGQCVGFVAAGFMSSWLSTRLGLGKVIALGALVQAIGYIFLIPAFPFGAMPVFYAISGWGMALQDAQANVFVATLPNAERKLSWLHAAYGFGAAVCPLAATAFASSGILFARFYAISLGLAALNCALLVYAFRLNYDVDTSDPVERTFEAPGVPPITDNTEGIELSERRNSTAASSAVDKVPVVDEEEGAVQQPNLTTRFAQRKHKAVQKSLLLQALTQRATFFSAIFLMLYVGSEVSMGGWIVTFLLTSRNGGNDVGYVATGFWLGLALGRLLLAPLNTRIGEKRVIYGYVGIALALELVIWLRDDLVANAVVVGIIGLLIGPVYPVAISILTKVVPRRLHAPSIAFCAAFGQAGSAVFPFITGALAQRFSPAALQPVMIALFACMLGLWTFVPSPGRKRE
ncbi:hypothetical protein JCM3770_001157 [Rhodotorula araucariae]